MASVVFKHQLLEAVVSTVTSDAVDVKRQIEMTFYFVATGVSTGATIVIEAQDDFGNWIIIHTEAIAATGNTFADISGAHSNVRARVSAWTDGTYTVSMNEQR